MPENQNYRTVAASEAHHIGPDGLHLLHITTRDITALEPVQFVTYAFDTSVVRISDAEGVTPSDTYEMEPGLFAVDLRLTHPMQTGEMRSFNYTTHFNYAEAPPAEFRKYIASTALRSLEMSVCFTGPSKLPAHVYWAEWDGYPEDSKLIPGTTVDWPLQPV